MTIHPSEFNVGSVFWECNHYMGSVKFTVSHKPISQQFKIGDRTYTQWIWKAVNEQGGEHDFVLTDGLEHYGPSLYREPVYSPLT